MFTQVVKFIKTGLCYDRKLNIFKERNYNDIKAYLTTILDNNIKSNQFLSRTIESKMTIQDEPDQLRHLLKTVILTT